MKRSLLGLMLLSVAFALACDNHNTPNNNTANANGGNANNPASSNSIANANNGNVKPEVTAPGKDTKTVAIVVVDEKAGKRVVAVPDTVSLTIRTQNIHFAALDAIGDNIESIELDFGENSPLSGGPKFTIGNIDPGGSNSTDTGLAQALGTFKYKIIVHIKGVADPLILDPQVEISGGRLNAQ
jgi:hypothetical protein